jgi:hypothetical protein
VIRPFLLLKGESNADTDRNLIGQTGSQLDELPEARFDPSTRRIDSFANSISPGSSDLMAHWNRFAGLIPKAGIHRIVVLDDEPGGYEQPVGSRTSNGASFISTGGGSVMINNAWTQEALRSSASELFDFGYTVYLRLEFLRTHQIDPIDLKLPNRSSFAPPIPYFEYPIMGAGPGRQYPGLDFPLIQRGATDGMSQDWHAMRHAFMAPAMAGLIDKLSPFCNSIYLEGPKPNTYRASSFPQRVVKTGPWESPPDWSGSSFITFISFGPQNTEDEQGELVWRPFVSATKPFCFDLRDVPKDRFSSYLRYLLKSPAASN